MIDKALEVIVGQVNGFLERQKQTLQGQKIALSNLVDAHGALSIETDSLGLCLVNIEEERVVKAQVATRKGSDGQIISVNPDIKLNLYVLFAANFTDYKTGLSHLSAVVRFFQSTNVFTHQNVPGMDVGIEKLAVDLHSLSFEQQNHLWGSLGAKYIPSVLYKIRLVTIQEARADALLPPIRELELAQRSIS